MEAGGARLHHMDALRALAMWLGIATHATLLFRPPGGLDGAADEVVGWVPTFSHPWRMPLFFLMAGIFAALVSERREFGSFVANRAERIGLPLAIGLLTIVPLERVFRALDRDQPVEYSAAGPGHLWFLEYLLIFYAVAVFLRRVLPATPATGRLRERIVGLVLGGRTAPLRMALAAAAILVLLGATSRSLTLNYVPDPLHLAYYGFFFGLGWLLLSDLSPLRALEPRPVVYAAIALALSVPLVSAQHDYLSRAHELGMLDSDALRYRILSAFVGAAAITALYGMAVRVFSRPRPVVRYAVDASYWMYLMHIVTLWSVHFALEPLALPWWAHYLLLAGITAALLVTTYALFVRYTRIGRVLHGPPERLSGARVVRGPRGQAAAEPSR